MDIMSVIGTELPIQILFFENYSIAPFQILFFLYYSIVPLWKVMFELSIFLQILRGYAPLPTVFRIES